MAEKALIAMSGGVDSSVAALLMKEAGYDCIGVTMKLYNSADLGTELQLNESNTCCSLTDIADARSVASRLGMMYYVLNFMEQFGTNVIDRFVDAYENGRTPNPCIDCNRHLKFDALFQRAKELGCEYVVTGHYARVSYDEARGRYLLRTGTDETKDQSYVLYSLTQEQLAHIKFPLGGMDKFHARELAEEHGFVNARKHDSQDICFVPAGKYTDFIREYTGKEYPEGNFVDLEGNVLGRHKGIIHYTIGQRKGLGLALPAPLYVCKVDVEKNEVVLGPNSALYSTTLIAKDINFISVPSLEEPLHISAKVRYKQPARPATVTQLDEDTIKVVFDEPQRAITKGQAVVLYDGDIVVGGGTITDTGPEVTA